MKVDFHLHSNYSADGFISPEALAGYFEQGDIAALTDHETIAGLAAFANAMADRGAQAVMGIEWFLDGDDGHLLTYFSTIPIKLKTFLLERLDLERESNKKLAILLAQQYSKFPSPEDILYRYPHIESIISIPVLIKELVHILGVDKDVALEKIHNLRALISPPRILPLRADAFLLLCKDWKMVTVLAHPFRKLHRRNGSKPTSDMVLAKVNRLITLGLDGLEIDGWEVLPEERDFLFDIATFNKLIMTSGSDFHDSTKGLAPGTTPFQSTQLLEWL